MNRVYESLLRDKLHERESSSNKSVRKFQNWFVTHLHFQQKLQCVQRIILDGKVQRCVPQRVLCVQISTLVVDEAENIDAVPGRGLVCRCSSLAVLHRQSPVIAFIQANEFV